MPGHIRSIDDYNIVEQTDIVYVLEQLGSINNIRDAYATTLMVNAGWPVETSDRSKTGRGHWGWNFYRASKNGNIWEDLESDEAILIGSFETEKTPPVLDINDNLLLKAYGYHLKDEGQNGNVLLDRTGKKLVDLKGQGIIHHDVDGYGNYYAEIFRTRSSGGRPITHERRYAFFTPEGERIGGKDKSFARTDSPTIHTVKSKFTVAGASPYYIYDMGINQAGKPEIYPNLAEMLISSMNSKTPFIKTPEQYLNKLFDRQAEIGTKLRRLQSRISQDAIDRIEYNTINELLTNELEATDMAIQMFQKAIARGEMESPESLDME